MKSALLALLLIATAALGSAPSGALAGGNHIMIVGMASSQACITQSWHGPPTGNSSVDLASYNPMNQCPFGIYNDSAGRSTYWQSWRSSGNGMYVEVINYTGNCTGVQLDVYDNQTWGALGNYWYVHISEGISEGVWWNTEFTGYTIVDLGDVLASDNAICWDGPHVHQGGDNSGWTAVFRNTSLPGANSIIGSTTTINTYSW